MVARLQHRSMAARFAVTPADINGEHVRCCFSDVAFRFTSAVNADDNFVMG